MQPEAWVELRAARAIATKFGEANAQCRSLTASRGATLHDIPDPVHGPANENVEMKIDGLPEHHGRLAKESGNQLGEDDHHRSTRATSRCGPGRKIGSTSSRRDRSERKTIAPQCGPRMSGRWSTTIRVHGRPGRRALGGGDGTRAGVRSARPVEAGARQVEAPLRHDLPRRHRAFDEMTPRGRVGGEGSTPGRARSRRGSQFKYLVEIVAIAALIASPIHLSARPANALASIDESSREVRAERRGHARADRRPRHGKKRASYRRGEFLR